MHWYEPVVTTSDSTPDACHLTPDAHACATGVACKPQSANTCPNFVAVEHKRAQIHRRPTSAE